MTRVKLVFLLLLSCFGLQALAGDPPYTTILKGSGNQLQVGAAATVQDSVFFNPSLAGTIQSTNSVLNVVSFRLNEFSSDVMPDSFRVTVHVDIDYRSISNSTSTSTITDSVLVINYNKYKSYTARDFLYFNNAVYASVKITSIQSEYAPLADVMKFLELENEIIVDRDYVMNCPASAISSISLSDTAAYRTGELTLSWTPNRAAEEYDLEWTYADNSALQAGNYNVAGQLNANLLFRHNSTRVSIKNSSYHIPMLYEDGGKLFFRVRAVQYLPTGERKTGPWSSDNSSGLGQYAITTGHEQKLNWQSSVTFSEEGKRKTIVQYSDGSLNNRQNVAKESTSGTTVISETLYDKQGRPAIQVMPTPTLGSLIKYTPRLNTINSAEYDKDVYDPAIANCDAGAPGMDTTSGASQYYSGANPNVSDGASKFIPNAYKFAFTETQYVNDNTGRIAREGGVGKDHQIGSGHERKYYYGTPSQAELDALFGTEAGIASHYQKNMVRDANGQYSVSYVDMSGRTIATALAGAAPQNLAAIPSNKIRNRTDGLLDPSNNVVRGTVIESVKGLLVPAKGDYSFNYQLNPQSLGLDDCNKQNICYDCLYDLEITITDDCNNSKLPNGVPYVITKNNFSLGGIDTTCAPAPSFSLNFQLTNLPEGSYTITKRLKLSQEKMAAYRDSLFLPHNTCKSYEDIYDEVMDSILHRLGSCINDSTATAAYKSYREQMLHDLMVPFGQYANPTAGEGCSFFSVFNQYTNPLSPYKDENGALDYVTVTRNGADALLMPQQLTKEEFIDNFKPSWAESLLGYHPEYCLLDKYENLAASHVWDEDFEKTETYAEAVAKGYLNPTANLNQPAAKFTINLSDPLFTTLTANGYSLQSTDARNKLNAFLFNVSPAGQPAISAWGYATMAAKCTETNPAQIQASCQQWTTNANAFNTSALCTGELDMAWRIFRGFYLDKKAEWVDGFIRTNCTSYPFNYSNPAAACTPNFPRRDDILNANGLNFTGITQYQQAQQTGNSQLNAFYDSTCTGYATRWFQQLATCNYSPADSAAIVTQLIAVCKEGSDLNHPLGSSSVKPSSTYPHRSFDDVIKAYNTAHGIAYNSECNGYLIDIPKAWEGSSITTITQPLYTKPDSCTCNRISQLQAEYNSSGTGYSSFSNFLAVKYQTVISQDDLNTLLGLCGGAINCKFIEKPVKLPPVLQCGGSVCADCNTVKGLYDEYKIKFPNALPALLTQEDAAQEKKNGLFENFMNNRLGFSKTYDQYLGFMDSCMTQNASCDSTWTVFNPGQDLAVDADLYANSYNNILPYSQHFDGQHFVAPPANQAGHYILANKVTTIPANSDTLLTVKWRVQVQDKSRYVNPVARTNGASGIHNFVGATWVNETADTTWMIGTTTIRRGAISSLSGLGLSSNSNTLKADYVRVYNSQNQLIYVEEFTSKCVSNASGGKMLCNNPSGNGSVSIEPDGPCADSTWLATIAATDIYRAYKDSLNDVFNNLYTRKCLEASALESFTVTHQVQEYNYTLYYYDRAGNLVKTIPPAGIDESVYTQPGYFDAVKAARAAGTWKAPGHILPNITRYNSMNNPVSESTPDGGLSNFWYDRLGRLAVTQNAQQTLESKYSYTLYDILGRVTEAGQKHQASAMTQSVSSKPGLLHAWLNNGNGFEQVSRSVYDKIALLPVVQGSTAASFRQKAHTMRNRVSHTLFYNTLPVNNAGIPLYDEYTTASYYSYDIHGNVDTLLQDYRSGMMQQHGLNRFKLMAYRYDLISGKVNQVHYQPGERDQFYHRYEYDADNRVTDVYTTFRKEFVGQKNLEDHEAYYQYYKHGMLSRTVLGQQQVQGVDYAYTLHGWLKGVNLDSTMDGAVTARDVYSYSLHYYNGDYSAINVNTPSLVNASGNVEFRPLYNGNIGSIAMNIKKLNRPLVYNYGYDQLNRLVSMDAFGGWNPSSNIFAPQKLQDYKERISYDANGNILSYGRNGAEGSSGVRMDSLVYQYERTSAGALRSNRLRYVYDAVTGNAYTSDIKSQTPLALAQVEADNNASQAGDNYAYDATGNLVKDLKEGITNITWTNFGKIGTITKGDGSTIAFTYDASGNRLGKTVTPSGPNPVPVTTWYARDGKGMVMAIYTLRKDTLRLAEQLLHGSERLGIWNRNIDMDAAILAPYNAAGLGAVNSTSFERGNKVYELTNYLGNVLATVSDKKAGVSQGSGTAVSYYAADITTAQDYYPYGMLMPGRHGYSVKGGWANGGNGGGVPGTLSVSSRTGNPSEYVASQEVEFTDGFETGTGDEFTAYITSASGNGATGGVDGVYGPYRYGFNGMENDDEVKGEGNQLDFGLRIYDPRLGRFLSVDPMGQIYPWQSSYLYASDNPIALIDAEGGASEDPNKKYSRFGIQLTPMAAGLVDGLIEGFSFWQAAKFGWKMISDGKARDEFIEAIKIAASDPVAFGKAMLNDYIQKGKNIAAFNAEGQYELGFIIGETASGMITGGAVTKFISFANKFKAIQKFQKALDRFGGTLKRLLSNPCGCLTAETEVLTKDGLKKISEIEDGEWVMAYDDSLNTFEFKQVHQKYSLVADTIYTIKTNHDIIRTTSDHPYLTARGWVEGGKLRVGDSLLNSKLQHTVVRSISKLARPERVYNFTVKDLHTFVVGRSGVITHNNNCKILHTSGFYQVELATKDGKYYIGKGKFDRAKGSGRRKQNDPNGGKGTAVTQVMWYEVTTIDGVNLSASQLAEIYEYKLILQRSKNAGISDPKSLNNIESPGKKRYEDVKDPALKAKIDDTFNKIMADGPTEVKVRQ
jgi:RHS repeat-associated protein